VKKEKFLQLLQNNHSIQDDDLKKIISLESTFPYSQVLHTLSAIGSRKLKSADSNKKLTDAAVYATDRLILKKLIMSIDDLSIDTVSKKKISAPARLPATTKKVNGKSDKDSTKIIAKQSTISKAPAKSAAESVLKPTKPIVHQVADHPGLLNEKKAEQLRAELMKNLEDLLEIKKQFFGEKPKRKKKSSQNLSHKNSNVIVKIVKKQTSKTDDASEKMRVTKSYKKPSKTTKKVDSKLLETKKTKTTKKVIQQDIIDKFIKSEPKIRRKKNTESEQDQNDLSKESVSFNDDLVSENLAKVMVKQGKTSKAIDIYKKLIWKFPQKKAYFASQIESLKEK